MSRFLALPFVLFSLASLASAQDEASVTTEDTQVGAWLVRCVSQGDNPANCIMINSAVTAPGLSATDQGQEIALLQIIRLGEDQQAEGAYGVQLTSPTNVNVRAGIGLQVDQTFLTTVPYEVCTVNNCITTFAITPDAQAEMEGGFAASLIFTDAAGQQIIGSFSLDGFARALERL